MNIELDFFFIWKLWVLEFLQNDFILEDGLMRVNGGKAIVSNVIKAVEIARQRDFLVVWVNFLPFLLPTSTSLSLSVV